MKEIATALVKAQSEMVTPKKANLNPFFKNKYAGINEVLEAVIPALNSNGIVVLQPMVHLDGKNFVKTVLLHESGEMLESFTEIIYNKVNDAQAQGSGITYARRYGLQSFVSVGADDDDGNSAVKTPKKEEVQQENKAKEEERRLNIQLDLDSAGTVEELGKKYTSLTASDQIIFKDYTNTLKGKLTPKTTA